MFQAESENIRHLQHRVRNGLANLRGLEIGDDLGVEILSHLIDGGRSVCEIVELAYGIDSSDAGYKSAHSRVTREISKLESKGLVSRRILGRTKPYRLTEMAVINLARIGSEERQLPVIPRLDLVAYSGTATLSLFEGMQAIGWLHLSESGTIGLLVVLSFLFGISFVEVLRMARRVF